MSSWKPSGERRELMKQLGKDRRYLNGKAARSYARMCKEQAVKKPNRKHKTKSSDSSKGIKPIYDEVL